MGSKTSIDWTDASWNPVWGCTPADPVRCANCYARTVHDLWFKKRGAFNAPRPVPDQLGVPLTWRKPRTIFVPSMGDLFHPWPKWGVGWPLPNAWIGASASTRAELDRQLPALRQIPAAGRFLSLEPLLEDLGQIDLIGIDWVIVGGESGRGARPMHPQWARNVRDQCLAAKVPFFFKQWGQWLPVLWEQRSPNGLAPNERPLNIAGGHESDGEEVWLIRNVGGKKAGHLLCGQEWRQLPWRV